MSKVAITFVEAVSREIEIDGQVLVVGTADMDQIFAMLAYTEPLQGELAQAPASVVDAINGFPLDDVEKTAAITWLMGLIGKHRDAVRSIVAISIRQPVEFVGKLLPDRFLALLLVSLEVNADFFSRMLAPLMALAQQTAIASGLGGAAKSEAAAPAPSASTGLPPSSS